MKKRKVWFGIPILTIVLAIFLATSQSLATDAPVQDDDLINKDLTETAEAPIRGIDIFSTTPTLTAKAPIRGIDIF